MVYKFTCASCNSMDIGETFQYFSTHVNEHLSSDKNSHVFEHLEDSESCRSLAN